MTSDECERLHQQAQTLQWKIEVSPLRYQNDVLWAHLYDMARFERLYGVRLVVL